MPLHALRGPVYSTPSPVENIPQNNECKMVELRGAKVASFTVDGCELICLPQAFDLFLKHLVGGLHTVYTKLKRLEITPVVCNVEQVRILRGLGAIQPGVNRCKLISRKDFETLYNDCTNNLKDIFLLFFFNFVTVEKNIIIILKNLVWNRPRKA
uniref:SKI/SNO/DAC domain-containing protein n=1 Tax=Poecilia mexicana TaxID=48701 RepID=A0A3B3YFA2_9TELE